MIAVALHNNPAELRTLPSPRALDAQSSDSTSSNGATISANDFLTLLVTEMQNQDPTANTDPNEYINQLVNVNSLEQLISINQTLSTAIGSSTTSSTGDEARRSANAAQTAANGAAPSPTETVAAPAASTARSVPGNLGIPAMNTSAQRVANSLTGDHAASPR
jgi:flagellar basal-body rod modification protein FlgD